MAKPILYDMVRANPPRNNLRQSSADFFVNPLLAEHLKDAVPFVIDDDTVRAAQTLRNTFLNQKTYCLLDVALPPFSKTWIEYNPRVKEGVITRPDTATGFAHLLFRSDDGISVMTIEAFNKKFYAMPYVYNWTGPTMTAPVRQHIGGTPNTTTRILQHPEFFREILMLGKPHKNTPPPPDWIERFGGDTFQPAISNKKSALEISTQMSELLTEHAGTASLLMGILAIMAFVPSTKTVMAPSGRWTGAGINGTKPFHRHTVVRVETGERQVYRSVTNAIREAQKRAQHDVREHWRVYRRGRPDEYRVKVESHKRGDPSIGIITHDHYETVRVHRER